MGDEVPEEQEVDQLPEVPVAEGGPEAAEHRGAAAFGDDHPRLRHARHEPDGTETQHDAAEEHGVRIGEDLGARAGGLPPVDVEGRGDPRRRRGDRRHPQTPGEDPAHAVLRHQVAEPAVPARAHEGVAHASKSDEHEQEGHGPRVGHVDEEGEQRDGDPRRVGDEVGGDGHGLPQAQPLDGEDRHQLQGLHDEGDGRHDADVEVGRPENQGEGGEEPAGRQSVGPRRPDGLADHVAQPAPALCVAELGNGSEESGNGHGPGFLHRAGDG